MRQAVFAAIDLKSFYASVECVERGLDPLTARLVVADPTRTSKTICLAVTPALKSYGLSGRSRLFEVEEKAREVKASTGEELTYIVAPPRMRLYMSYSARIYEKVYMKYASPNDIHVYSVDEVFIDLTRYLTLYGMEPCDLVRRIVRDILRETGITATAGVGTNLYLAKVAMDIVAKHAAADEYGARLAMLDEAAYRALLWVHRPLTDFWRVGRGIARRLAKHGCFTMGDVARKSLVNEEELYREFGVDAELLIDHAWGVEPCTMADIKAYRPQESGISSGQVLSTAYTCAQGRVVVQEMADQLALDLAERKMAAAGLSLAVCFDRAQEGFEGETELDPYGRAVPKTVHGAFAFTDAGGARRSTCSGKKIVAAALTLYDRLVPKNLYVRRFYVSLDHMQPKQNAAADRQMDLFCDGSVLEKECSEE
ncbi:MAG: DNA methylase, partial [Clostridia bacterium]|nr:DNA methylase [Clostridia bacterium]